MSGAFYAVFTFLIIIFGPWLLEFFFGNKYAGQTPLVILFTILYAVDGVTIVVISYIKANDQLASAIIIRIITVIVNIGLLMPLLYYYKETGGIAARLGAGIFITTGLIFLLYKKKLL